MRIIVDAMGGDNAPAEIVKGAVDAQREFDIDITLVGRQENIEDCLSACGVSADGTHLRIVMHPRLSKWRTIPARHSDGRRTAP